MGMIVSVYRDASDNYDCTMGGMTNNETGVSKICIVNVDGPFEPTDDAPAATLERGPFPSAHPRIVPTAPRWVRQGSSMFGGNFAYTSDSRFRRAVEKITGADSAGPVAIHDRFEG